MFDKLLTENIGFFSDRHSSEFIARLTTGATAANLVLSLLITSIGRDVLHSARPVRRDGDPGSGDVAGRAGDRATRHDRAAQAGAPRARDRQDGIHRRHAHHRDLAGDAAGPARRQGVHARRRDAPPPRRQRYRRAERSRQVGARRQPREPADGDARRPRDRARHRLQRLSDHLQRRRAWRLHLVPRGVPARL